ncbi:MAG: FMN-dependent NADH-azoreductase [Dinoroseobacter sp.]|jgi:FMN-dependent NADH-azoreductase
MTRSSNVLRIDSSARTDASVSRKLADQIIDRVAVANAQITKRDLGDGLSGVSGAWLAANFTPEADRSDAQRETLALSDALISEVMAADTLVISLPIYNFGLPSSLKAWIDQIARAGITFKYTPDGPVGLLEGKRAYIAVASGGTEVGGPIDFATGYLRHVLGFVGITDVQIVASDRLMVDADASAAKAQAALDALAA